MCLYSASCIRISVLACDGSYRVLKKKKKKGVLKGLFVLQQLMTAGCGLWDAVGPEHPHEVRYPVLAPVGSPETRASAWGHLLLV